MSRCRRKWMDRNARTLQRSTAVNTLPTRIAGRDVSTCQMREREGECETGPFALRRNTNGSGLDLLVSHYIRTYIRHTRSSQHASCRIRNQHRIATTGGPRLPRDAHLNLPQRDGGRRPGQSRLSSHLPRLVGEARERARRSLDVVVGGTGTSLPPSHDRLDTA